MNLNELRPSEGSKKGRKRVGRGHGSGWGKTAGKGHNGQKQRAGASIPASFEGGQMPLIRRIPKRGFSNVPFKKELIVLNIKDVMDKFNDGEEVSLETLVDYGIVKRARFIKKYSDEKLRSLKGRKLVKEYLAENVDSYVKEKDYKGILKIIGETEVTKKLNFRVHRISENTKGLIEKAGGTVEILNIRTYSAIAGNNKKDGEK